MDQPLQPDVFRFIINPKAGPRDGSYLVGQIEAVFAADTNHPDCRIILTEQPGHATQLAAEIAAQYGSRAVVVACGGDGTAREVATGLVGTRTAMSILPIGTANDFARCALSTCEIDRLLTLMPHPQIRKIDTIAIDDQISLNITSLGFDTKVQRKALQINARCRWLGSFAYPLAIVLSLFGNRQYAIRYRVNAIGPDGSPQAVEGQANMILAAVCNGRYYGGGYNPAPDAKLDDGRLFFCLVDNLPLQRILKLIPRYKKGTHLDDPSVHSWSVVSGDITGVRGELLGNYDGDSFSKAEVHFRVLPESLYFAFY